MKNHVMSEGLIEEGFPLTAKYLKAIRKEARVLSQKYNVENEKEDIVSIFIIKALELERVFDLERGVAFISFVRPALQNLMSKLYGYSNHNKRIYKKVKSYVETYKKQNKGITPDIKTISKAINIPQWEIRAIFTPEPSNVSFDVLGDLSNEDTLTIDQELILKIKDSLTDDDFNLIIKRFVEEQTIEELADFYKVSLSDISLRLSKILTFLKGVLE